MATSEAKFVISASDRTKAAFASINQRMGKMTRALTGVHAKIAAVVGVGGMGALVASSLKSANALAKTSDKLGITTEKLAGLRHAAELSGVASNTMDMAMQRMTRRVAEAAQGTGEAKNAIAELGLSAQDLAKMSPDKAFTKIAGAMENVPSQSDKVRLAFKLFDSEGVALVNTLALGEKGLNAAALEAEQLGIALTRVDAAKIEAANDAMTRVQATIKGAGNAAAVALAPYIEATAKWFVEAAKQSGGFGKIAIRVMENVTQAVGFMANTWRGLEAVWAALKVGFHGLSAGIIGGLRIIDQVIVDVVNGAVGAVTGPLAAILEKLGRFNDKAKEMAASLKGLVVLEPSSGLAGWADEASQNLVSAQAELFTLVNSPMPADNIKAWFEEISAAADAAAAKVVEAKISVQAGAVGADVGGLPAITDEKVAARFAKLQETMMTEQELLRMKYSENLLILDESWQAGIVKDGEYYAIERNLAQDHQSKLTSIEQKGWSERQKFDAMSAKQKTQTVLGEMVAMTQGVAQQNKAMFQINKVAAIANASINAYESFNKTMAAYPYPINIGLASLSLAASLAQVSAIASTSFGGGGGSVAPSQAGSGAGSVVAAVPAAGAADQQGSRGVTEVHINGNMYGWSQQMIDDMIESLRDATENRDVVVFSSNSRQGQELAFT